ncbi:MAG: type II/IV secretion system protein [Phycisphaerales bacterium]|nr:type II/IV secretion system protein [Phycisphaerales bacterium]
MTEPTSNGRRARCELLGIDWLTDPPEPDAEAVRFVSAEVAARLGVVPLRVLSAGDEGGREDRGGLLVGMADPLDLAAIDELSSLLGCVVQRVGIDAEPLEQLMRDCYGTTAARMAADLDGTGDQSATIEHNLDAIDTDDLHRMAEQPSLINLVNLLLLEAIRSRASDVHIEPFEKELTVKYRVDGVLYEQSSPPKHLQPAITSRIKIMAGMNIAERYVPQDGHITLRFEGRKVDLRVSTVPTLYGESVVMRILDKQSISLNLESLGMSDGDRAVMDRMLDAPHGMILVTGPTGSGKTTTLYACLQRIYTPAAKIITIEDPVEYELSGINQIPVNPKRGLSFASGLRSILRQDPDIIMVGEIRDGETAEIAIRAALTGHLIFSTLHTNNATAAIGRLFDMGAEPFLVSSVTEGILAQRLGRRVCMHCAEQSPIDDRAKRRLTDQELSLFPGEMSFVGHGCDACANLGTHGRIGYFELLRVTPAMRAVTSERGGEKALRDAASADHVSMRTDGLRKAAAGLTTIEEVLRATQDTQE